MTTADQYTAELRAEQRLTAIVRQRFPGFDYAITRGEIIGDAPICLHATLRIEGVGSYGTVTVSLDPREGARIPDVQPILEMVGRDLSDACGDARDAAARLENAIARRQNIEHAYRQLAEARAKVLADSATVAADRLRRAREAVTGER